MQVFEMKTISIGSQRWLPKRSDNERDWFAKESWVSRDVAVDCMGIAPVMM